MTDLFEKAKRWAQNDPDEKTKLELNSLLIQAQNNKTALADLESRFSGFLEFGTAGLRAEIGAGESRMNLAVIRRATAGLCEYLRENSNHQSPVLIVGNDARWMSEEFATEVCRVAASFGVIVKQLPSKVPTPLVAYTVKKLKADCGVMITASHNPPKDNGYKVYDHFGAGIIPPVDEMISNHIAQQNENIKLDLSATWEQIDTRPQYLERLKEFVPKIEHRDLKIAYTPMHGVGLDLFMQSMQNLQMSEVFVVSEQAQPDPTFKTVLFPNPEEPGATDLLLALANKVDADLAIAHDPDADRCAVGVKYQNTWRMLKGDELGILLAWWLMQKPNGKASDVYCTSLVSSSLVPKMAQANGFIGKTTLTGMKWAGHIENLVFGYEEAIGYAVDPEAVSDKDGISTAILVIELLDWAKGENRSIFAILDEIYQQHGLHLTQQISVRLSNIELAKEKIQNLISNPPKTIGTEVVEAVIDMKNPVAQLPPSSGVILQITNARVIVRPSGTEPKIKCYLEVIGEFEDKSQVEGRLNDLALAMESILN
jgi:phosphomannomutase